MAPHPPSPLLQREPDIAVTPGPGGYIAETHARTGQVLRAAAPTEHRAQAIVAAMWESPHRMALVLDDHQPVPVAQVEVLGPEVRYVRSYGAVMPDPAWEFTDAAGHRHQWAATSRDDNLRSEALPTLQKRRETVHCDGTCGNLDCEGWTRWAWNCRECGALVEPGYIPDHVARTTGIPVVEVPERTLLHVDGRWPLGPYAHTMSAVAEVERLRAELYGDRTVITGHGWLRGTDRLYRRAGGPVVHQCVIELVPDEAPDGGWPIR